MADESYNFTTARTRLEAIVTQVRKKDTSLEQSLDLLEEGVRLANACTELIDHADWVAAGAPAEAECATEDASSGEVGESPATGTETDLAADDVAAVDGTDAEEHAEAEADDLETAEDSADPADEAWADDEEPMGDLGADGDPSADER